MKIGFSKARVRTYLYLFLAGAVGAMIVGLASPAGATPLNTQHNQPEIALLSVNGASCELPYVEVSGVTRDSVSVTLYAQQEAGDFAAVNNDSVSVLLNHQPVETYYAHAVTQPGDQFVLRVLPPETEQYRLVISGLDDSIEQPLVDVRFNSSTAGCSIST